MLAIAIANVMWSSKKMFKATLIPAVICYILHVGITVVNNINARDDGCFGLAKSMFAVQALVLYGCCVWSGCVMQRITKMKGYAVMYALLFFVLIGLMVVCNR
jgi:hypothetical protein